MLRIHFTCDDLARTTIAAGPDPLWELLLSLHVIQHGRGELVYGPWRREARRRLPRSAQLLFDLAPPRGYSPDFLTPTYGATDLDEVLDAMRSTPRQQVRAELEQLAGCKAMTPWIRRLARADSSVMRRLADAMRGYYGNVLKPYWLSLNQRVAVDRARRMRQLGDGGLDRLFGQLGPGVTWESPVLTVRGLRGGDIHLRGRGMTVLPSYFCWAAPTKLRDAELPPVLVHPIVHTPGDLRPDGTAATDQDVALADLLGRTRSLALRAMARGCTTTELARACDVRIAAASRHATVLREAGLITTRRRGGAAVHEITPLGAELLDGGATQA
ncbi:MAG: helix-turn-helix domain-containing protein [Streptosporangiales bacterium]|nr:helix-turn-helix domain-containing protein [Streptosporangiales bacterium]